MVQALRLPNTIPRGHADAHEIHDLRGNQAVAFTAWARINIQPRGEGSANHTHKTLHLPMSFLSVTDGKAGGCPGAGQGGG